MSWCPDTAKVKKKMLYSSSFDALKKSLVGVQKYIQATDLSEASEEAVEEKLRATDRNQEYISANPKFININKKNQVKNNTQIPFPKIMLYTVVASKVHVFTHFSLLNGNDLPSICATCISHWGAYTLAEKNVKETKKYIYKEKTTFHTANVV